MTTEEVIKYLFKNSDINECDTEKIMGFTIVCFANLFISLSAHYEEDMQLKLLDEAIRVAKKHLK